MNTGADESMTEMEFRAGRMSGKSKRFVESASLVVARTEAGKRARDGVHGIACIAALPANRISASA